MAVALVTCLTRQDEVAARYEVTGVDVSHYQGAIDWDALAADGHEFAFIKATEGRGFRDKAFFVNWTQAGRTGLRRGAYHFFRPEVSVAEQASNFFRTVDLRPGDLPPVLDVEDAGYLASAELVRRVRQLAEALRTHYGVRPIIYTGQHFYNRYLAGQIDAYPLWLARYHNDEPVTVCGRPFDFWQYSDRGRLPGVTGRVDVNVFTGSYLELVQLCVPPPPGARGHLAQQ